VRGSVCVAQRLTVLFLPLIRECVCVWVCACVCVWDRDWRCRSCHRYGRDVPQESLGLSNRAGGQESDLYTGARAG